MFKNARFVSNIDAKNKSISEINDLYLDNDIYVFIEELNRIQNSIKQSAHGSILFLTSVLNFANANVKNDVVVVDKLTDSNSKKKINVEEKKKVILEDSDKLNEIDFDGRVNNALATASKDILKEIKNKWNMINDYLFDDKYSSVSGLLKDSEVVVASKDYVVISNKLDSVVLRINNSYDLIQDMLENLFGYKFLVVAISNGRWKEIKNEYIVRIKNGEKYTIRNLKEESIKKNDKTPVDDLIDLVGDNVIEFK